ncbi:MAG: AMP-binding enzyme, partial [Chloroflexota bacterium]
GYRIELGEIETALYSLKGVKEAAAVAIPDDIVGNRIKAVVVPAHNGSLTANDVKQHCSQHLPNYMVPELIDFVAELPRTSTGKVNRPRLANA